MKYGWIHIILFFLLASTLTAQEISLELDGVPSILSIRVLKPQTVKFISGKLNVPRENLTDERFGLRFEWNNPHSNETAYTLHLSVGNGLSINRNKSKLSDPFDVVITPSYAAGNTSSSIIVAIKNPSGEEVARESISVNLIAAKEEIPIPADCVNPATKEKKLSCLENQPNKTTSDNKEINDLIAEREKAKRILNNFQLQDRGNNTYEIRCADCQINQFTLALNPSRSFVPAAGNQGWRVSNIPRDVTATIASKDWPKLDKKSLKLKYQSAVIADKTPTPEEAVPIQEVTPDVQEQDTTTEISSDSIPRVSSSYDTLWQDSIVPLLTLSNIIRRDSALYARLSTYQLSGPSSAKRTLAACMPYWWLGVLLLAFPLLLWLVRLGKKRKKSLTADTRLPIVQKAEITSSTSNSPDPGSPIHHAGDDDIQISEISKEQSHLDSLDFVLNNPAFESILLDEAWADTAVSHVYMSRNSIQAMGEMLRSENYFDKERENLEELSEIGGFLLGQIYRLKDDDPYQIIIDRFLPITPETNDRFTVKFGDTAWSELDDAFRDYPGQRLVGWFHTHPGHGLFLSEADIKVHTGSFRQRYQIAIEIDPTTPNCDMAFFSWRKDGRMNNREDRLMRRWWSFSKLENASLTK